MLPTINRRDLLSQRKPNVLYKDSLMSEGEAKKQHGEKKCKFKGRQER